MATITDDEIASVSLKDAARDPDGFAKELGRSFENYGVAIIADHGIPDELIARAEDKAKAFFALPEALKTCEPKALRYRFLHVPARLTKGGRRRHLRLPATWPWVKDAVATFTNVMAIPMLT